MVFRRAAPLWTLLVLHPACFSAGGDDNGSSGDSASDGTDSGGTDSAGTNSGGTSNGSDSNSGTSASTTDSTTDDTASTTGDGDCPPDTQCVDMPGSGWMGPVVRWGGTAADSTPPCPSDYPSQSHEGFQELAADPAQCGVCACGTPTDVECTGPVVRLFANSGQCGLGVDDTFMLGATDECIQVNTNVGSSVNSDPILPAPNTGSCPPSGGGVDTAPEPSWGTKTLACGGATSPAACGDAGMCVPAAADPFAPEICVYQAGDVPCPGGSYSKKIVAYGGYDDQRACTDCGCNSPAGSTCDGFIQLHANASCGNLQATIQNPGTECVDLSNNGNPDPPLSAKMIVVDTAGGQCVPSGGKPDGEVLPTEPVTFCCTI